MSIGDIATTVSAVLWMALAIYGFAEVHKWDVKFEELHETILRDMEKEGGK